MVLDENFDAGTLYLLRGRVTACALSAGLSADRAGDVTLAVSELAANTVRHGPGHGRVRMSADDGALRCLVSDNGTGAGTGNWPVQQGHGLWIVRAVADQVTISAGPGGSQVTAAFAILR
jgi:anti-sigma regulatory factor (Ser/Thr protein kinase)